MVHGAAGGPTMEVVVAAGQEAAWSMPTHKSGLGGGGPNLLQHTLSSARKLKHSLQYTKATHQKDAQCGHAHHQR